MIAFGHVVKCNKSIRRVAFHSSSRRHNMAVSPTRERCAGALDTQIWIAVKVERDYVLCTYIWASNSTRSCLLSFLALFFGWKLVIVVSKINEFLPWNAISENYQYTPQPMTTCRFLSIFGVAFMFDRCHKNGWLSGHLGNQLETLISDTNSYANSPGPSWTTNFYCSLNDRLRCVV